MDRARATMTFLIFLLGVPLGAALGAEDPNLVGWWTFDDGSGSVAKDASGNGRDGTLLGGPQWIAGKVGAGALSFDGVDDMVQVADAPALALSNALTLCAWVKLNNLSTYYFIVDKQPSGTAGTNYPGNYEFRTNPTGFLQFGHQTSQGTDYVFYDSTSGLTVGRWTHVMVTVVKAGQVKFYLDGTPAGSVAQSANFPVLNTEPVRIGGRKDGYSFFNGCLDDVRIYNRALTVDEIKDVMAGLSKLAANPNPVNGAVDVPRDASLSWSAGKFPASHDVYLSQTLMDVSNASRAKMAGVLVSQGQAGTTFTPAGVLAYGQTYYWRIDEVNKSADGTINKGSVWSFTAESYAYQLPGKSITATASSAQNAMGPERTIDGSGLTGDLHGNDGTTMWLSTGALPNWIQYQFDKTYKLYDLKVWNSNQAIESFLGFGAKDVKIEYSTDGTTWTALANVPQFAQAPGIPGYAANTTVTFAGVLAKYVRLTINSNWGGLGTITGLSEVRFSYVPLQARAPQPVAGATGQDIATTLSWRPGREAGAHKVFFGTDPNAVANGAVAAKTVSDHAFDPGTLAYGTTYYWRVDEVNATTTAGDVWSFTTATFGIVDDFESYNDDQNRIYDAWIDGVTDGKSGSQVGYNAAPFAERTIVHGGTQSMPLAYDNSAKFSFSEATRTFTPAQDWTASRIKSLSLWFRGAPANTGGQLYLKINGTKVSYNGNAADLMKPTWTPWNIDLSTVSTVLSKVTSLTIGIEGSGSKGILYVDDIRLYPQVPQYVAPVDPGKANLMALWSLDGDAKDSSGKGNNGTVSGFATWVTGKNNKALQFDGSSTYVDCGGDASLKLTDAVTISAWIKPDFTGTDHKIAGNQDGTTGGYKMGVYSNNLVEFEIRTSANVATLNRTSAGGTTLQQGVWYHVAGVYSKGQYVRTYVYGNLDRELVTTVLLGSSTGTFKLGREPMSASYYWLGALDDVAVYNRALAPEEISWLSGQTTPVAKPF